MRIIPLMNENHSYCETANSVLATLAKYFCAFIAQINFETQSWLNYPLSHPRFSLLQRRLRLFRHRLTTQKFLH